jgi:hypothetical protein
MRRIKLLGVSLLGKWKLFSFALITMVVMAMLWNWRGSLVYSWDFSQTALIFWLTLLGPFTELASVFEPNAPRSLYIWALVNLALLFAHPFIQSLWAALVTVMAFICWLLAGIILVYSNA